MKKKTVLCGLLVLALALTFSGCGKPGGEDGDDEKETAREELWGNAPEGAYAILINLPTPEQEEAYPATERLVLEETHERFLLIPAEGIDTVTIWALDINDVSFPRTEAVYVNQDVDEDFILDLTAMRPEGGPHYQLSLSGKDGTADYYISYDGKDGNPNIEYVMAK